MAHIDLKSIEKFEERLRLQVRRLSEAVRAINDPVDETARAAVGQLMILGKCSDEFLQGGTYDTGPAASFRRSILMAARRHRVSKLPAIEWRLTRKDVGRRVAQVLDIPFAAVRGPFHMPVALDLARAAEHPIVIKPNVGGGSRGVYVIFSKDEIMPIKTRQIMSWPQLEGELRNFGLDSWLVEDFLNKPEEPRSPAPDLKFYCFYGKVGLVLEIERHPELRYCWWNAESQKVRTGRHEKKEFAGRGFDETGRALAERVSGSLPVPFMRIDFLRSGRGLMFGEFTPRPGGYHTFDDEWDRLLGDMYLAAEARLSTDFLSGKTFHGFQEAIADDS